MPLICLLIDFVLNNIVIEWSLMLPTLVFITMYLCVLIAYSLPEGQYVYPILKFESQASWNLIFFILIAVLLVYVTIMVLNAIKFGILVKPTVSISDQKIAAEISRGEMIKGR